MRLSARIATLELAETFVISRSAQDTADVVYVELEHDGVTGYGEATPIAHYGQSAESALAYLEAQADALGDDPWALEEIESQLPSEEPAARAAIDAALHDLQGKLTGRPVWRLLGLRRAGPPTSWTIWLGDPDDMARRTEAVAGRFKRLKLKLGGRDGLDVERVRAVRGVTNAPLMVDVNEAWSLDEALEALAQLDLLGVEYCEQPLPGPRPGRPGAQGELAAPDLRRRGLPHGRRRPGLRGAGARREHQAREVGRDPRSRPDRPRRAGARARRDARLHERVGPCGRGRRADREPL